MTHARRIEVAILALTGASLIAPAPGRAQSGRSARELTVGIYAPSVAFADSGARLAYVQGLADAIQERTGTTTNARAFVRYRDLIAAKVDVAILDGVCVAARGARALATARIAGATEQRWGLYSPQPALQNLKGKRLAYVTTGCRDTDFVDNALFQSEVASAKFFGALVPRLDVVSAVTAVRDYGEAEALFAPPGMARGLTHVFETPAVPNPGLVVMNPAVDKDLLESIRRIALEYRGSGRGAGIDGWAAPASYSGLADRLAPRRKRPVFADPDQVRLGGADLVILPKSSYQQTPLRHHFWVPGGKPADAR